MLRADAERVVGSSLVAVLDRPLLGQPDQDVLVRSDHGRAYYMVGGIPVLLSPEALLPGGSTNHLRNGIDDLRYREAYAEMAHYNAMGDLEAQAIERSHLAEALGPALRSTAAERDCFPSPRSTWIETIYDGAAQWDAYRHIAPVRGRRVMQLGGTGIHAVKFLLAGAAEAWVCSPMMGELRSALELARLAKVDERLHCVAAVAEELPFPAAHFDLVYSGGSVHHMATMLAMPEIARVIRTGGKFAAMDPWRAPLYAIGKRLVGNRLLWPDRADVPHEDEVECTPLTNERVRPFFAAFKEARLVQHWTFTRYALLGLNKMGLNFSPGFVWQVGSVDDFVSTCLALRSFGSSVALLATKT